MNKLVYIESPYAGDRILNTRYLAAAISHCIRNGEAPFASHAIYTLALDDSDPEQRAIGLNAGECYRRLCLRTVVYVDLGISHGMAEGIRRAELIGQAVAVRTVPGWTYDMRVPGWT